MSRNKMMQYEGLEAGDARFHPYLNEPYTRVLVLLDLRNIVASLSNGYPDAEIDFGKLNAEALDGRRCASAFAVDGTFGEDEWRHSRIQDMAHMGGFTLVKVHATNGCGKQEGTDVMLSSIATEYVCEDKCDCVVFITGDGDFACLAEKLQKRGIAVEVMSFVDSLSGCLRHAANKVTILDDLPLTRIRNSEEAIL
ncbi:MAG: NYN domain-containing protein [Candidatus Methanomethylophilaceae archaeon]|nr:NYN domain-containing protein [Candidatus Methanomethylophilaceae archaeon]